MDLERIKLAIRITAENSIVQMRLFLTKNRRPVITFCSLAILVTLGWWLFNKRRSVVVAGEIADHSYTITYVAKRGKNYQPAIDSMLTEVIETLDSQRPSSAVAQLNDPTQDSVELSSSYLYDSITKAKRIYQQTQGAFDPTIKPLLDLWRQSLAQNVIPQMVDIQRIQQVVGLDYIVVNEKRARKLKEGVQVDLDVLLDSYAVDVLAAFLETQGVERYGIKIGNSARSLGYSSRQGSGVSYPLSFGSNPLPSLTCYDQVPNRASTILPIVRGRNNLPSPLLVNPQSGWITTEENQAIVVFANDCTAARAYAVAFLVLGWERATAMLNKLPHVAACKIRAQGETIQFDTMGDIAVQHQPEAGRVYFLPQEKDLNLSQSDEKNE